LKRRNPSDKIENATGNPFGQTIIKPFFIPQDKVTLRSDKEHKLTTDAADDVLVFNEKDDTFNVSVSKENQKKYIVIGSVH
jgi:oligopeptidase B